MPDPVQQIFNIKRFLAAALVLLGLAQTAGAVEEIRAYHCITAFENGSINWSTGKIIAVGKAIPGDPKLVSHDAVPGAARADANRAIIDIMKNIRLSHDRKVREYAANNDVVMAGIEKTARDAVILKQYYTSALAVEMTIETSIYGGFLQLVLPDEIKQIPIIKPGAGASPADTADIREQPYSGLIVDARGLDIDPVLNPMIISEQGEKVYSAQFISREFAVQKGVCKYICSMKQALADTRIGRRPLVVKALRKEGEDTSNIVINMAQYRRLEKIHERHTFLKQCRVIIVKDQ